MLFSALARCGRSAALTTLFGAAFAALAPAAAFATGTVTLAWNPSAGTNVIANYRIYYGVASATYTNSVSAGTNLTVSVSNLVEGVTYYFAATAMDTAGLESDYSTEVSAAIFRAPTLNTLANVTINENAGLQTINLSGITSGSSNQVQTLVVTASSSSTGLIPNPTVNYTSPNTTGSISFTPVAYANGSATITVTVNNGGVSNNVISRSFTVTVKPVNQPPTLNTLANITLNENAGRQTVNLSGIGSGAGNESQTLTVTTFSSNTGLIPTPTVTYTSPNSTGSIAFTPVANANGTATISVTVNDGGLSNNIITRTFTVTVNQVNSPPTISALANRVIAMGTPTSAIAFTIGDAETAASSLALSGSSDNTALVPNSGIVFGGSNANRTVTVTPASGRTGVANIRITVSDGMTNTSGVFQVSVRTRPAAPGVLRIVSAGP